MRLSMRLLSAALLATLAAASTPRDDSPLLGAIVHTRHPVHSMDRSELEAELTGRGVAFGNSESDDDLRVRIYVVRSQQLQQRRDVLSAEARGSARRAATALYRARHGIARDDVRVAHQRVGCRWLTGWVPSPISQVLSDDFGLFANQMGARMLAGMKQQVVIGVLGGMLLRRAFPLGPILAAYRLLPFSLSSRMADFGAASLACSAAHGIAQLALRFARRLVGAPSYFCPKLTAAVCRDAILEGLTRWPRTSGAWRDGRARRGHQRAERGRPPARARRPPHLLLPCNLPLAHACCCCVAASSSRSPCSVRAARSSRRWPTAGYLARTLTLI